MTMAEDDGMNPLVAEVLADRRIPSPARARAIRIEAGVSQRRLAEELGVSRVTVARWELSIRTPRGDLRRAYARLLEELQREVLAS